MTISTQRVSWKRSTLKGPGPFTVFAPTDEAFAKVPKADLDALLADKAKLREAKTVEGQSIRIDASSGVAGPPAQVLARWRYNGGKQAPTP